MSGRVDGDTAIVTGAARGIGKAIARKLGEEGANVVIADVREGDAEETVEELTADGLTVEAVSCDVTDRDATDRLARRTEELFGGADILVNNAGIGSHGSFEEMSPGEWDQVIDVNLNGPFNCCHSVVPGMIDREYGRIVNISSMAGRSISYHGAANYTASKWGLIGFTKHLAWDLGEFNVTVNAVCPGSTKTDMTESSTSEAERAETARKIPLDRWATPEDQAEGVLYFAAESGDYTTGTVLEIDGGKQLGVRNEV